MNVRIQNEENRRFLLRHLRNSPPFKGGARGGPLKAANGALWTPSNSPLERGRTGKDAIADASSQKDIPRAGSQSGYALLVVMGMLAIFAVLGIAFSMRMRMEETSSFSYKEYVLVNDVAKAAVISAQEELRQNKQGDDGVPFSGDEGEWTRTGFFALKNQMIDYSRTGAYDSRVDRWYGGFSGRIGTNTFDTRRFSRDSDNRYWHYLGTDEDPVGDWNNDGAPGFAGVDDDLDGLIDEDRFNEPMVLNNGENNNLFDLDYILDDDEDGRIDEDRRDIGPFGLGVYQFGEGLDDDGDRVGIFDECAKLHLNLAGNIADDFQFSYNQALGPWELDLGMFLAARLVPDRNFVTDELLLRMQEFAEAIVTHKYGDDESPGVRLRDDSWMSLTNPFDDTDPVYLLKGSHSVDGEALETLRQIVGNGKDDNGNGVYDDETEVHIGHPMQVNSEYWAFSRPGEDDPRQFYLPGDGLDNNSNGEIDELGEAIDNPGEFNPFIPLRYPDTGELADSPWQSLEEFRTFLQTDPAGISALLRSDLSFVDGIDYLYQILQPYLTLHSKSPLYSPGFFSAEGTFGRRKIYPNLLNTYTPKRLETQDRDGRTLREDFSNINNPNPPFTSSLAIPEDITYFYPASIDDDDDWRWATLDEEGLFTLHDLNGNFLPDSDWDGTYEPVPPKSGLPWPPVMPQDYKRGEEALDAAIDGYDQRKDLDNDNWMGDTGDFNADGEVRYDPEWGINEDPPGRADGTYETSPGRPDEDDDLDLDTDLRDVEVSLARSDSTTDGIDNDGDGIIDEAGETYIIAFDDDEDGRWDEDGPEIQFWANLLDCVDEPPLCELPLIEEYENYYLIYRDNLDNAFMYDASFASGAMAGGIKPTTQEFTYWTSRMVAEATPSDFEFFRLNNEYPETELGATVVVEGVEAVRINEVFAYPLIRLQMEHDDNHSMSEWDPYPTSTEPKYYAADSSEDKTHTWEFTHLPPGEYRVFLYRPDLDPSPSTYVWPDRLTISTDVGTPINDYHPVTDEDIRSYAIPEDKTIEIGDDGVIEIEATLDWAENASGLPSNFTALDYIELVRWHKDPGTGTPGEDEFDPKPDLDLQYIELVNLSDRQYPIDISGWTIEMGRDPIRGIYTIPQGTLLFPDDPLTPDIQENYLAICRDPVAVREIYLGTTVSGDYAEQLEAAREDGLITAWEGEDLGGLFEISTGITQIDDDWHCLSVGGEVELASGEMSIRLICKGGITVDEVEIPDPATALYGTPDGEPAEGFAQATLPFQVFEKGDPTATEYEIAGPVRRKLPNRWARFYAKDALIIDRGDQNRTSWKWDPGLAPDEDYVDPSDTSTDFFCYENDRSKESQNIFVWLNPPVWSDSNSRDRFLRVRVFGQDGYPVGQVVLENAKDEASQEPIPMNSGEVSGASMFIRIEPWQPWSGPPFGGGFDPSRYNDVRSYLLNNDRYRSYLHIEIETAKDEDGEHSFFKYVEFCSFGDDPDDDDAFWYLAGSPAAPNALYEPFHYDKSQEHKQALVRNSRLANFYDLSRIATGGEFEVLGAEKAAKLTEYIRLTGSPTDQAPGLININTAPKPVLMALPWAEPEWARPGSPVSLGESLMWRYDVAERIASAIIDYRENMLEGFDGQPGKADVDDNQNRLLDEHSPLVGISERNWPGSDDPPFDTVGDLASLFTDYRSDLYMGFGWDARNNPLNDLPGMENASTSSVFGRIANLTTVRSDVFTVRAEGKVLEPDGGTTAKKLMEAVFER